MEIAILAGVATAGLKPLLEKAMGGLMNQYSMVFRKLKKNIKKLETTLEMIEGYLRDLDNKSISGDAVNVWLRKLENMAFHADNVLDELNYHLLPKKTNKRIHAVPFSYLKRILRMRKMTLAIRKINKDFKFISDSATALGIQYMVANAPPAPAAANAPPADVNTSLETDSVSHVQVFVERVDDVTTLVDKLTQTHPEVDKRKFYIVAVVGMPGVGKTTLIREVINRERVKSQFGSLLWVHVSQKFDTINLFKKIHYQLTKRASDKDESKDDILKRLKEALEAKTYLLVLDDVWNESSTEWDNFMTSMLGVTSTMGNGIIISTRIQEVATAVQPFHTHSLNVLSDDGCWSIIQAKAFGGYGEVPPQFEKIGKEIAEKCGGLPLAANLIGSVLRQQKSKDDWDLINKEGLSNVKVGEEINKVLILSLDYLPSPSHKKCFLYCSIFPKGHIIVKQKLIELWMGEGFLQPIQGDDMESMGNMYFNVLLQNSLLQVYGEYGYVMHDVVHKFASSVFVGNTPVRYMFREEDSSQNISKEEAKHLRTLILKGGTSGILFTDFHCLHNLTLDESEEDQLPDSIRELIHLRNLDLSDIYIDDLPKWIGELSHLQTLRMPMVGNHKLPNTLNYLVNLRHLYFNRGIEWPAEIGRLTSLRTLPYFEVGEEKGYHIEELRNLKNLKGELTIKNLERVRDKEEAQKANILQKQHLSELRFEWGLDCSGERNDESVLEGLRPHANLKKLRIEGYKGKRYPTWLQGEPQGSCLPLHNLIELILIGCSECEEITLDHLPNLRSLTIIGSKSLKCLSERFFYNNRNLSDLYITECDMLEALPDGLDTLNYLEELTIERCRNLKSMGNSSCGEGENQGTLRRLSIADCGQLMEVPRQMLELWAPTIEVLVLYELRSLKNLPMLIDCMAKSSHVKELTIKGVPKLMSAGSVESWDLGSLRQLDIDVSVEWSKEISVAVNGILEGCCKSLDRLILRGVDNWEWLPQSIQYLTSLSFLKLKNVGIEELPQWFGNLSALEILDLYGCTKLRCLPSVGALKELRIKNCPELGIDPEWSNHPNLKIRVDGKRI